jgi:signal transduction histidine kinase
LQLERAEANLESDPASAQQSIEGARSETERLQRLVDGLLMLARADGATAPTERVDVSGVVRERVEIWQPLASERGVTLRLDVIDGLHARLLSNALEQIVDNIVDNSLNASHEGGTISVSAAAADGFVVVSVADDGPGLSDDQITHAFDRFWRAPDAPHGGSGIGLAVVRQLTFSSGGAVELRNRDSGHGLVATVSFPADTS